MSSIFDFDLITGVYQTFTTKVDIARKQLKRPLTYTEKILYAHLFDQADLKDFKRGSDYVDFAPDRVAMQDATAQMALLQFMQAGKNKVAVPSTVHADHLIQAHIGADKDLQKHSIKTTKCITSSNRYQTNTVSVFGNLVLGLYIR